MATEPTPTDAELLCLIEAHLGLKPRRDDTVIDPRTGRFTDAQRYRDFARAVLARWGAQPAPAASPVPLTDEQIDEMHGEANRGYYIEREHYWKAVRDTEAAHGITKGA